jgi:hypothetical protein
MGTKPGVGDQDQAPLSDLGAEMETDALLASLGSQAPASGGPRVVVELPSPRNATRSAKTRVAGAPVVREEGASAVDFPSPPHSLGARFAAFGASVTLALVVGVPLVLKIDGPRTPSVAAGSNALSAVVASSPPPAVSAMASVPLTPPPSGLPAPVVSASSPAQPSPSNGKPSGKGQAGKVAPGSSTPIAVAVVPTTPAVPEKPSAPPPAATPAPPATTAAPASTLTHGGLVQ